jgi:hypothetical protein
MSMVSLKSLSYSKWLLELQVMVLDQRNLTSLF